MRDLHIATFTTTMSSSNLARTLTLLVCLTAPIRASAEQTSEAELVRRFLDTSSQRALASAARAQTRAERIVPPYLRHPELEVRREQAFGEGTAFSTTVAGVSLSFEIGGRHGLRTRAAALSSEAVDQRRRAERLASICALRRLILTAAHEERVHALVQRKQLQLETLLTMLQQLVRSGEKAPFELERTRLLVRSHARTLRDRRAAAAGSLARLRALTGLAIRRVTLAPVGADRTQGGGGDHPRVRSLQLDARAATTRSEIAARSWVPDLGLHGAYRLDYAGGAGPGHGYELGLSLNLPFTDAARADRAATAARRARLRAAASQAKLEIAARIAALQARAQILTTARARRRVVALEKLYRDALRRYLGGVTPLGDLVDTLQAAEAEAVRRLGDDRALRSARLELECLRGAFADKALEKLLRTNDRPETR